MCILQPKMADAGVVIFCQTRNPLKFPDNCRQLATISLLGNVKISKTYRNSADTTR